MMTPPVPSGPDRDWRVVIRARMDGLPLSPADLEDVIEELAQHLERAEADLRSRGIDSTVAWAQLEAQLDDPALVASIRRRAAARPPSPLAMHHRPERATGKTGIVIVADGILDALRDLRFGVRSLARERGFTAFVVTTLALGIGANAATFGVLDRLLLRGPLHVRDAGQVRRVISTTHPQGRPTHRTGYLNYVQYETFRTDTRAFAGVAAYNLLAGVDLGTRENARPINRGSATASFFPLLGVQPALGRFFNEREDDPNDPQYVAVLGYELWQTAFGGRRDVLGATIHLEYSPYTIIGVAPEGFTGVDLTRVDVWVPESGVPHSTNWRTIWYWPWLHIVVRLQPNVSPEQAAAALTRMHRHAYVGRDSAARAATLSAEPTHYTYAGAEATETRVTRWLSGVAAIVLLITCANVVNLLLARAMKRRRELAVRLALGAGRLRLIRLLMLEALVLTVAGGAAAMGIAYAFGAAARALIADIDWATGALDARILWMTAGLSLLACLLVGVVPAVQGTRAQLGQSVTAGTRESGGRTAGFRTALTVSQAALSVVLLVGAGLFVKSLHQVRIADLGIDTDQLLSFRVDRLGYPSNDTVALRRELARQEAFLPMMVERLRSWPEIERVSMATAIPFVTTPDYPVRIPGRDSIPILPGGGPYVASVSSDYFATVGTPIRRGRAFTPEDRTGSAPVAVINETTARLLWPGESPLGKCVIVAHARECARIVGVAANTKRASLHDEDAMQVYVPQEQLATGGDPRLLVRPRGDAAAVLDAVRRELLRMDPSILLVDVDMPQQRVDKQVRPWRLGATVFTLFGVLALLVASVGLYSVISYLVTQRTREIGVRIALGARPSDVAWLILSNGFAVVGAGIAIGLVLALFGAHAVASLLFETSPRDPLVLGVVAVAMMAVAIPATLVPTWRARRIDPMVAIRME